MVVPTNDDLVFWRGGRTATLLLRTPDFFKRKHHGAVHDLCGVLDCCRARRKLVRLVPRFRKENVMFFSVLVIGATLITAAGYVSSR